MSENWKTCETKAEAYKSIGQDEIYLDREDGSYPWEHVVSCEPGGSHRMEIATDVWFKAIGPSGLKYRWSFDIEPYSANGSGSYHIDVLGCKKVLMKLNEKAAQQFRAYLAVCAKKVRKKADEYAEIANNQRKTADALDKASYISS